MADISYLTQEGYDKLKKDLEQLKSVGRPEAARAIAEAREKGDLSENAEYDAAKEAQGLLELKITQMSGMLASSRVLDETDLNTDEVRVFHNVRVKNMKVNKEFTYKLVSETEADLKLLKISVTSPIGKCLLGKKIGEIAEAQTPGGLLQFKILEISI